MVGIAVVAPRAIAQDAAIDGASITLIAQAEKQVIAKDWDAVVSSATMLLDQRNGTDPSVAARLRYLRGLAYDAQARIAESSADFATAVALQPSVATYQYRSGAARLKLKEYDQAIAYFNTAVKLAPREAEYHYAVAAAFNARAVDQYTSRYKMRPYERVMKDELTLDLKLGIDAAREAARTAYCLASRKRDTDEHIASMEADDKERLLRADDDMKARATQMFDGIVTQWTGKPAELATACDRN
jgi:tetratricopeptide (TPR) repeat protein